MAFVMGVVPLKTPVTNVTLMRTDAALLSYASTLMKRLNTAPVHSILLMPCRGEAVSPLRAVRITSAFMLMAYSNK